MAATRLLGGRVLDAERVALAGDLLPADQQPGLQRLGEAAAHARRAGLLAGAVVACSAPDFTALSIRETRLRNSSSARVGVALADRGLEAAEPGLHLGSAAPVLEALALRPMNPLFL